MTDLHTLLPLLDLPRPERDDRARDLGLSPTAYAQRVLQLLWLPEAEQAYPQLVRRWRRIMDARRGVRRGIG